MLARVAMMVISVPVLTAGIYALLASYAPDLGLTTAMQKALHGIVGALSSDATAIQVDSLISGSLLRFLLAPVGVALLAIGIFKPSADKAVPQSDTASKGKKEKKTKQKKSDDEAPKRDKKAPKKTSVEKRFLKKAEKHAQMLAKKGDVGEAAELLFEAEHFDKAAEYFVASGQFIRAAEIRHDQNRFVESAELYLEAGRHESAGSIFAQQEEFTRAAECYEQIGSTSVAAEMYEKGGEHRKAAECYMQADFLRHAASAYVKCKDWRAAADCLDRVFTEDSLRNRGDEKFQQDLLKLARQAAKLFRRAEDPEKAMAVLERAACYADAAEIAIVLQQFSKAADLYQDAGEPEKAAEALRNVGEDAAASRILGNLHRDRGDAKEAAECFEAAGEFADAGDLYRSIESYEKAGDCFMRQREFLPAAEMYALAEDHANAATCYESARHFKEAAQCRALLGQHDLEAALLDQAGEWFVSGQLYHREGLDEEAITTLQKVGPDRVEFSEASALLGDIFQARGQLSLAIKKLKQAIGERELDRDSMPVYYSLATICYDNDEVAEAVDVFEKILAYDYHYKDVEQRLVEARERLKTVTTTESSLPEASGSVPVGADSQPGRYQIVGELGRGGMGIVYKAKDTSLDRMVAYKVLPEALRENPQALKNFLREAQAAAKLNHPNIVTVYDTGLQDARYYIAMEYVDGTTLKEIVRRRGPITSAGILHVLVQMCEAMAYAHEKKVVHRDIKTANVMWARDKKAKLMDFGLAKVIEEVRNHTTVVSGTPYYMSPEQTLGKNIDHRTDIYSLGVTMFELAAGTVPFKEGNIPYHHVHTPPPDVRELQPELPESLAQVINRCLLKDPAQRYQSTSEILDEVRASMSQTATQAGGKSH